MRRIHLKVGKYIGHVMVMDAKKSDRTVELSVTQSDAVVGAYFNGSLYTLDGTLVDANSEGFTEAMAEYTDALVTHPYMVRKSKDLTSFTHQPQLVSNLSSLED